MVEVINCRDMPMDYDDSEFSIHNVELTEEVSSTVSSVLRPYDYEDAGHLSFDSLVENEVFLGITGQEDNQWIEEYSRGTSSSVVESKHDNVWSEAASSESVEMLLKSVGQGTLVTESGDEPGSIDTNVNNPILKQEDENNHAPEEMVTTEELGVSDEPGSVATNIDPSLNHDGNNHALEAMVTNNEQEEVLATEELVVSDEPLKQNDENDDAVEAMVTNKEEEVVLATNKDPILKQDDENNHGQEAMLINKEEVEPLATEELDVSDEPGSLGTNMDPILKQDDEYNHAQEEVVTNKEEVGPLVTEELDPNLNQDDENNHAQEAVVTNDREEVLPTEELVVNDEHGSLSLSMDLDLKQDDGNNHAQEVIVINKAEEGVRATEEFDVSYEPGSLAINMDSNLKQDDGNNHALEAMVIDKEVGDLVTEESDNVGTNLKQDDGNSHAHEVMIINKPRESFNCDEFNITVTKDSQEETDVLNNICDLSEEKVDGMCDDVNHEAGNIGDELSNNKMQEDLSTSKIECGNLDASKECELERCPSTNEAEFSTKNTDNPVGSHTAVKTSTNSDVKPSNVDSLDKPPVSMTSESCLLMSEACAEACELNNDIMHEDLPLVTVEDDGKTTSENLASLESNVCSPLKVSDAHVEESEKPDAAFDSSEMGEGSSNNDTCTNMDLVATPKVHSGDTDKDQSPAGSVQQKINDEVQSSEKHGGTLDMDVVALDSQHNIESVLSDEGCKAQGSEADITILAEPGYIDATSPILGVTNSVHHDIEKKEERFVSDGTCETLKVASIVNCASLCVVENMNAVKNDLAEEANPDDLRGCSTPSTVDPILCDSSIKAGDNNEAGGGMQESISGHHGDMSSKRSVSTKVVLTSESNDVSMDKLESLSPLLNTINTELSQSTVVKPCEGAIDENTSFPEPTEYVNPSEDAIDKNTSLPEATEHVVLTSECNDTHMGNEEDTMENTNKTEPSPSTRVEPSEGDIIENIQLSMTTEDVVVTPQCDDSRHEEDTCVSMDTGVKPSEGATNDNTSLLDAAEDVVLISECDNSHMKHESSSASMDKTDSVSLLSNTNNSELSKSTRVNKSSEDAIDENTSLTEEAKKAVLTSELDSVSMDKLESVSPVVNKNNTEDSQSARVIPIEGAVNESTSHQEATEDVQPKEHSISSESDMKTDTNFTFEVTATAGLTETCKGLQLFPASQSMAMEGPCIDSSSTLDPRKPNASSVVTPQTPGSETIHAGTKERKRRRKSVSKESVEKGKETTTTRSRKVAKSSPLLITSPQPTQPAAAGQVIQFQESGPKEKVECSLPDLNKATSIFHQPFTNNQQVQLRAQILVYGSLISGMPPEEPHMIAAFEQSDAGRKTWEDAWRACLDRLHVQKSQANTNTNTPVQQPRADLKDVSYKSPDLGIKHTSILSSTYKGTPPAVTPLIPVPSPLWNMPTPSCVGFQSRNAAFPHPFTPIHHPSYQTTPNPLWLSQSPFLGQWGIASLPGSPVPRFSGSPITEAVKLTPVNVSGVGHSIPVVHSALFSPLSNDGKKASGDSKSRKRKKVNASDTSQVLMTTPRTGAHNRIPYLIENQTDSVTAPVVTSIFSTSVTVSAPPATVHDMLRKVEEGNVQEANVNPTDPRSIKRTKITTSSAVNQTPVSVSTQNQSVSVTVPAFSTPVSTTSYRSQNTENAVAVEETLTKVEKSKLEAENAALLASAEVSNCQNVWSGLDSDAEAKLMSSISAAATVAKMASAAAKFASNIAEQAALMADEVFQSKTENFSHIPHPNLVITAAREAARRRIEAASAASKHAENLDAIVKAAELAGEAVSQVGKIVAMGDSSALRIFAKAGPEGFWKIPESPYEQHPTSNSGKKNLSDKVVKETQTLKQVPQNTPGVWEEHSIKEGCLVEVYKENGKYKGAWLAANVLSIKDEMALICYTGIQSSDEGSEKVKEWVAFGVKGSEKVPRIRIAHPMTTMRFEGARKRRRTAVTDYAWSKGDRVDVWIKDCWREGIVLEPNKIDVTTLTVQFPAQGETSVVRSWHVRPTLIWKDRQWIEWNEVHTSQGELPKEKRMKLGSPPDKLPIIMESGTQEEQGTLLPLLSSQETCFNVGKNTNTNKPTNNHPTIRKDKARVVFGVPKPGKKQKFMAVSTQYIDDRTNKNIATNSSNSLLKFPKPSHQVAETKSRLKPRKPPVPWFRTTNRDPDSTDTDSVENSSSRQNQTQVGPSFNKRKESPKVPPTKKAFAFTSKTKSDPPFKGRKQPLPLTPKMEVKGKSDSQVNEPRRSNRRIQPTSRLLEGLQSSLTVSKIPSVSHAAQRKVTSKGNTTHGST